MPLGLLIPLLTPILTELITWGFKLLVGKVPSAAIPVISTALGTASAAVAQASGVPLGIGGDTLAVGAELGLAGTGVHQVQMLVRDLFNQNFVAKKKK